MENDDLRVGGKDRKGGRGRTELPGRLEEVKGAAGIGRKGW